ncbi:hypothetical protein B0H13DRAFT_1859345 [Mycena leptocephala]|nr:hypothetical protein B0H13DRAFT_1859345 [Mycena leptocephala]
MSLPTSKNLKPREISSGHGGYCTGSGRKRKFPERWTLKEHVFLLSPTSQVLYTNCVGDNAEVVHGGAHDVAQLRDDAGSWETCAAACTTWKVHTVNNAGAVRARGVMRDVGDVRIVVIDVGEVRAVVNDVEEVPIRPISRLYTASTLVGDKIEEETSWDLTTSGVRKCTGGVPSSQMHAHHLLPKKQTQGLLGRRTPSEETAQQIKNPKVRERRERPRDPERLNGARFHGKKLPTSGIHGHCSRPSFHARRLGVNTPGQVWRYPCGKPVVLGYLEMVQWSYARTAKRPTTGNGAVIATLEGGVSQQVIAALALGREAKKEEYRQLEGRRTVHSRKVGATAKVEDS